ncbi:MAG: TetR/AcrR family transcriptional regulator [Steroidobacteraceae bacterium]
MPPKTKEKQVLASRQPRQARALHKVELILEAAMRVIDRDGIQSLTTNAVAATAGVSIGTLYQYFRDKQAILDAVSARELGGMSEKIVSAVSKPANDLPGDRVRDIVRAVMNAYGGRKQVHRQLLQHSLTRGAGSRLHPLYEQLTQMFTAAGVVVPGKGKREVTAAQAFVMTHAVAGVMRGLIANANQAIARQDIEAALSELLTNFLKND